MGWSPHSPTRSFEKFIQWSSGSSVPYTVPVVSGQVFPQGCTVGIPPTVEMAGKGTFRGHRWGLGASACQGAASGSNRRSHDLLQLSPLPARCLLIFQNATGKRATLRNFTRYLPPHRNSCQNLPLSPQFSSVQSLSRVRLFETP